MKDDKMNVEALSRAELLTLLSILEGELEAQDVVIHALRAQQRDSFVQERYGLYDLSDPFLALQRDNEPAERQDTLAQPHTRLRGRAVGPNPLAVLKLVMAHCKSMQERMMGQLTAAERRYRRVIADLEEEKQRHAQEAAHSDDFASMLQTDREKLLQQLEEERATVRRLEQERSEAETRAEESLSQQEQLSSSLTLELQKASGLAQEEAQKVSQLRAKLQEETSALEKLRAVLADQKSGTARLEARSEWQLAEFDAEREQMRARLAREEERSAELERQVNEMRKRLAESTGCKGEVKETESLKNVMSTSAQTEPDGKITTASKSTSPSKVNGHPHHHTHKGTETEKNGDTADNGAVVENGGVVGGGALLHSPLHPQPHPLSHPQSPSSTASSSLSSSPASSPVLTKRLGSPGFHHHHHHHHHHHPSSPSPTSSYQAGVNQRFQAARHKFQSQAELEQQQHQQHGGPLSPRDLSPTTTSPLPPPEHSAAKQLARNTVAQALSRFASQQMQAQGVGSNSSPFGTDYRNVAGATPPRSPSGPLSPGIRSPLLTPRSDKSHPPPLVHPKKPGMSPSPTPGSPCRSPRTSLFPELTGNCAGPDQGAKDTDLVLS